jgi:hypothetical protein
MAAKQKVPEAQVLRDCKTVLEFFKNKEFLTYRRIPVSGIPVQARSGKTVMVGNTMRGMADLLVFLHSAYGGHVLHIEVKGSEGRLSVDQKAWRDELAGLGHQTYYVVQSQAALLAVLKLYRIPLTVWARAL